MTYGPAIIARTLSKPNNVVSKNGSQWQYHPRSDHHSKIACWAVLFDLLSASSLMQRHAATGKVAFGINRELNDWTTNRTKNLDLVVARTGDDVGITTTDLVDLADKYGIGLTAQEQSALTALPTSPRGDAGAIVLVALEAKACMTEHSKARSRLYDELTSSYQTVHGDSNNALAVGLVMVNRSDSFVSPLRQHPGMPTTVNAHQQPKAAIRTIEKMEEIHRRSGPHSGQLGFDALGILVVDSKNDGSPVELVTETPAPPPNSPFHYDNMIRRAAQLYDTSFNNV
ncbi:hypothetical protein ASG84_19625 [Rhodococcus sp. Leaf278]|uniref:hypothetical protein n=1 Tax=Rhodococcus sp. Leaf278 TaxID=1736319 RepID=UPI000708E19D|nr:hypothetical protein [Rhodococcus sp. Leaf278]KQU56393.1 hypothetical protein ASG84_19625 [Rhodococcus sp. Leaf278]